jgi:hypothetical protein
MERLMNKFMGIAAAAILAASSGNAMAGQKYISFDGYCDFLSGVKANTTMSVAVHNLTTVCGDSNNAVEVGVEATIPGVGKYLVFADNDLDAVGGTYSGTSLYYAVQLPLKTGNSFFLYETSDGATISYSNSGTYTVTNKVPAAARTRLPATYQMKHSNLMPPR